jgi:hypothetical protein
MEYIKDQPRTKCKNRQGLTKLLRLGFLSVVFLTSSTLADVCPVSPESYDPSLNITTNHRYTTLSSTPSSNTYCSTMTVFATAGTSTCLDTTGGAANAVAGNVLYDKAFWNAAGAPVTGTMPNHGAYNLTAASTPGSFPAGYVSSFTGIAANKVCSTTSILGTPGTASCSSSFPTLSVSGSLTYGTIVSSITNTLTFSLGSAGVNFAKLTFSGDTSNFMVVSVGSKTINQLASAGPVVLGVSSSNAAADNQVQIKAIHPNATTAQRSMTVTISDANGVSQTIVATATPNQPPFSSYGTLIAHYDAMEITGTSGDSVSSWADLVNGTYDASPPGADQTPTLYIDSAGLNYVKFDGSNDYMSTASKINGIRTVYVVMNALAGIGDYAFLFNDSAGYPWHGGVGTIFSGWSSASIYNGVVNVGGTTYNTSGTIIGIPHSSTMRVYEIRTTAALSIDRFALGNFPGRNWKGHIAEILIYSDLTSNTTPNHSLTIRCLLKEKWGLTEAIAGC